MAGEAENGDGRDKDRSRQSPHDRAGSSRQIRPRSGDGGRDRRFSGDRGERQDGRRGGSPAQKSSRRAGAPGQRPRRSDGSGTGGRSERPAQRYQRGDRGDGARDGRGGDAGFRQGQARRERPEQRGGGYRQGRQDGRPGRGPGADRDGGHYPGEERRPLRYGESRPPQADRPTDPAIDEDVTFAQLDRQARQRLRTLSKESANRVGRHLVMAGLLVESDPELAYQHAHSAMRRAGRVDVVREAVALTAYATGRYAEALREIRTVRRLSGLDALRAIEADCERGLGRPERALDLAAAPPSKDMTDVDRVELAIVASGARLDLDQPDAALLVLEDQLVRNVTEETMKVRVAHARATALRAAGRDAEADALEAALPDPEPEEEDVAFAELEVDLEQDGHHAPDPDAADPGEADPGAVDPGAASVIGSEPRLADRDGEGRPKDD